MTKFPLNRWNWDEEKNKWVYVEKSRKGKVKYTYQIEPPEEFLKLTEELKNLNDQLMAAEDYETNITIFKKLMKLSEKMNNMRKQD